MTAQANQPAKFLVPFAQNDSSRVEIPVTTTDATRASQSAGFPPLTMQPPEAGGVPPQGEDFNGALNQVARIAWWLMLGGGFGFDGAFATATQIGGYPKGAVLQGVDLAGDWISTVDNNSVNPDTSTDPAGGGYVPGYQYGVTSLTGLTGGTVTLTNAQAAKSTITLAGTLTSALTIVVPTWRKNWTVTNNTTGAFAATVKTAAGTGITVQQNGAPQRLTGDGTNIVQPPENIAAGTAPTHAMQLSQATGRVLGAPQVLSTPGSGTYTKTPGTNKVYVRGWGAGGGGGGAVANAAAGGGGGGGYFEGWFDVSAVSVVAIAIGGGGAAGAVGSNGGDGGATSFGVFATATGGGHGGGASGSGVSAGGANGSATGGQINLPGAGGNGGLQLGTFYLGGGGGAAVGMPTNGAFTTGAGGGGYTIGGGGAGGSNNNGGGQGGNGLLIIYEYA